MPSEGLVSLISAFLSAMVPDDGEVSPARGQGRGSGGSSSSPSGWHSVPGQRVYSRLFSRRSTV